MTVSGERELVARQPRLQVGVVGGSLGGLFAAALLAGNGHEVTVFERSGVRLSAEGAGVLAREPIVDILRDIHRDDVGRIAVSSDERVELDLSGDVVDRETTRHLQLSWDYLYEVFRQQLPSANYLLGHTVRAVHPGERHATVELDDGREQRFDLVVGADGEHSVTRASVVPGRKTNSYSGYAVWSGLVAEQALDDAATATLAGRVTGYTAHDDQVLGYLVPGPGGETAAGSRRYQWLWSRAMPAERLAELVEAAGGAPGATAIVRGTLPDVLRRRLATEAEQNLPFAFGAVVGEEPAPSLRAVVDYTAPRMVAPRVALLGDAAVIVRPHAAMSAAKAARDAVALADFVEQLPLAEALAAYERDRLPAGKAIASYGRIFANSSPLRK